MDVSRRRFLVSLGQWVALGGTGLLAACQGQPESIPVTSAPAAAAPTKPAAAPAASPVAAASPAAAASPGAAASGAASPAAAPKPAASPAASPAPAAVASPSPAPVAAAAGAASAGKPQYQMDALHTGRSPHRGARQLSLQRTFDSFAVRPADSLLPSPDIQSSTAVGADGTIYATNFGGELLALKDGPGAN